MKIALVSHNTLRGDGQGRVNLELVKHALASGHQVTILGDVVDRELIEAGAEWVEIHPRLARPNLLKVRSFASQSDAKLHEIGGQFDIIVGNGYTLSYPHQVNVGHFVHGAWIRSPYHVSNQGFGPKSAYQWLYSKCNARWEKIAYSQAKTVVAISELTKLELISIGVPEAKVRRIPNGVDLEEFSPAPADREQLGLPAGVQLGLFVGDIRSTRKNLDTLLKSLQRVPDLHLAVIGTATGSPFPAMAEQLGLADRVHFLGFRRDVAAILRAVDLFLFPSRYETFGLVVLEALASGVPVITTQSVGASELMTSECGVVIPDPENADLLTQAILKWLDQNAANRVNARRAARAVAENYSWSNMAQKYLDLFEEVRK